ncbi:MAG: hypothetical protein A2X13_02915 [Bacteroidetes bacterium GWC2_33_15]|nr:MAG: hypothetical protein A2X10_09450 [Bacteroidetes bacterium GWA2_33_15]OFX49502.1 MAG: hypothetical protein A2X13_02915 [Bacteroidetes bacterium GWC2_33_15]OFX63659.1 MAG: hypothetical protein A2X15_01310 [Bacteroidetes bacterium GWB2_32_14]OFX68873.1 MAG: hypothetical protein A2X14_13305 [Bacteroidetes bacterium GWD2_33_33]HAN17525.1 hypothetical protein [Bacteroidales bacterium]
MSKKITITLLSICFIFQLHAQVAPNRYRVFFVDKNNNNYTINAPEQFLSEKAINRRLNQGIEIRENDLPVSKLYVDSLKSLGLTILNQSKWMNSAVIYSTDQELIDTLDQIGFIKSLKKLYPESIPPKTYSKTACSEYYTESDNSLSYGESGTQISMLNGHILHQNGYMGQGITIAVIDAGFYNSDILPAFDSLFVNNQVLDTYDFVAGDSEVYSDNSHGMKVLSIIAGNIPGQLIGTAPKANFLLLRSEDVNSEYSIEEDNWVSAAEYADSAGTDIINTSLGYTEFDDPSQNYTYSTMDGNSTFISRAADIAASKGILVVVSAGNLGDDEWKYISAPADADSVLTVGAVDAFAGYVSFSSQGPTFDGRIKPNVAAMGYQTVIQDISGQITKGNGTSFSAPIISGLAACLWQALPDLTNMEIISLIEQSAHHFSTPDYELGYGIPDFAKAANLTSIPFSLDSDFEIDIFPNPFSDNFKIYISNIHNYTTIELFNVLQQKVYHKQIYTPKTTELLQINNINNLPPGIYILKVSSGNSSLQKRVSKID